MKNSLTLKIDKKQIANITFNQKTQKINKLDANTLIEFEKILDDLKEKKTIQALVIKSAKKDIFIAGADINEIRDIKDNNEAYQKVKQGQNILNKITSLPFPTICFINEGKLLGTPSKTLFFPSFSFKASQFLFTSSSSFTSVEP